MKRHFLQNFGLKEKKIFFFLNKKLLLIYINNKTNPTYPYKLVIFHSLIYLFIVIP